MSSKINLRPQWLCLLSVSSLFVCCGFLGPCFVLQHFVSFISVGKRELVALPLVCSELHAAFLVLCFFLAVPWVGLLARVSTPLLF